MQLLAVNAVLLGSVAAAAIMALYAIARSACGLLTSVRSATFDNIRLFWYYTAGQGLFAFALIALFPRLIG